MRTRIATPNVNVALCATLSLVYLLVAYWVVFQLRIGPVVAVISSREGWGVHTGDVFGVLAGGMGALVGLKGIRSAR